jgi:GTP:adenosylcobinamide-phosphate guanylyltransferase
MKNIVILAAGPPKHSRNRHLEVFGGKILIDRVIEKCACNDVSLSIVINKSNHDLIKHVGVFHKHIIILTPDNETIYSTFKSALSIPGDCILVCGDLINIRKGDVEKFVNSNHKSAICRYSQAWGAPLSSSTGTLRRSDMGDCISMISEDDKSIFLGQKNYDNAVLLFKDFYPNKGINYGAYNDIGTHMMYSFFKEIWSDPGLNSVGDKGTIFFEHKIYEDND